MTDLLIRNVTAVTVDAGRRVIENAAIAVRGDRIVYVGTDADLPAEYEAARKVIDGHGMAAMPETATQPNAVIRNACRRLRRMPSLGQVAMAAPKPMKPVTRAAVTNGFQSWS